MGGGFIGAETGLVHGLGGGRLGGDAERGIKRAGAGDTRRNEGVSIWAVEASAIAASAPEEKGALYEPANDKVYRHPTFYDIPDEVGAM